MILYNIFQGKMRIFENVTIDVVSRRKNCFLIGKSYMEKLFQAKKDDGGSEKLAMVLLDYFILLGVFDILFNDVLSYYIFKKDESTFFISLEKFILKNRVLLVPNEHLAAILKRFSEENRLEQA